MPEHFIFWTTLALIVYAYAGFPLLLLVRSRALPRPVAKAPITPRVTLVIVAHNEVTAIESKLHNILTLDYPRDRLEVIVASDGSDDGTDAVVARYADRGIRLLVFPRSGKIPALNVAVRHATGDILVFSDANSIYAPDALRALLAPFADPAVGAVGGNQRYVSSLAEHIGGVGERMYWNFDRRLKAMESSAGNMTSATGAIHAIRRTLFLPVPNGVGDDFVISTRAIIQGYRLVFEPAAVAFELVAPTDEAEFKRKVRVIVRGLRGLWAVHQLFNPIRYGFYTVQIVSHKLLRWSVGWLLLAFAGASIAQYADSGVYRLALIGQALFYACALSAWALRHTGWAHHRYFKAFAIPYFFCLANYAALCAWVQVLGGKRLDVWDSQRAVTARP